MSNPEEAARRLLDSISESLNVEPGKLARVFITPSPASGLPAPSKVTQ